MIFFFLTKLKKTYLPRESAVANLIACTICTNQPVLPSHDDTEQLCNNFSSFFGGKIDNIRNQLDSESTLTPNNEPPSNPSSTLQEFRPALVEEVDKLIIAMPNKSCVLDKIPAWLFKEAHKELAPSLADIINSSLANHDFPSSLKQAYVTPLIKKASLDKEEMKNYRPVSNIPIIIQTHRKNRIEQNLTTPRVLTIFILTFNLLIKNITQH
ncbi:hypothetical protein RRG08_066877 [Elysia crispata]|uniref:Uncharacterized protein n=1 Tax=Elysia crispata TaxID=231223 RepID=A0AAE1CXX4_9GAST|nr:hypothetical protein RRG08_066877 [Elysia crispata]